MADLGTLLKNLSTQEGRAKIVKERIDSGDKIPEQYITEAINFFEEKGKEYTHILTSGAELARKAGREDKAIQIYKEAIDRETKEGNLGYAADIADRAQMFERAIDLHLKASIKRERENDFYNAAEYLEDASNSARSAEKPVLAKKLDDKTKELFLKTCKKFKKYIEENKTNSYDDKRILEIIQEITEKAGIPEKIPELYEAVIKNYEKRWDTIPGAGYRDAARFAEKVGMDKKAKELNLLAIDGFTKERYYDAIELAEKVGGLIALPRILQEKILKSMEKSGGCGSYEIAAIAEKMGLTDKAKGYYIQAMEGSEREGRFRLAAEYARKAGREDKAKIYRKLEKLLN